MTLRGIETALARSTLGLLVLYVPLETWYSLPYGLSSPFYLVDLIAMALLFFGARASLRARPRPAPGLLCAALGWTAANGWRSSFGRLHETARGNELTYGTTELWVVGVASGIALFGFGVALYLVVRDEAARG